MLGSNFDPFNQRPTGPFKGPIAGTPMAGKGDKSQRNKVLRFMFNPEIGDDLRNMRGQHEHFLKLIANIFLQTGLIDAAYPGFTDPSQLTLRSLILEAYHNLRFTREGLPQVLLFGAFIGSLVVVGLSVVFFVLMVGASSQAPVGK